MALDAILSSQFALFLLVAAGMTVGVVAGFLRAWSVSARLYALETQVAIIEGTVQREVKVRAGMMRQRAKDPLETQIEQAIANPPKPAVKEPWYLKYANKKVTGG